MKYPNCKIETTRMEVNVDQWSVLNHSEIELRPEDEEYLKKIYFSDICPKCGFMGFIDTSDR